jgi:hypothetical protein
VGRARSGMPGAAGRTGRGPGHAVPLFPGHAIRIGMLRSGDSESVSDPARPRRPASGAPRPRPGAAGRHPTDRGRTRRGMGPDQHPSRPGDSRAAKTGGGAAVGRLATRGRPAVLCGDLNAGPRSPVCRRIGARLRPAGNGEPTFFSLRPLLRLDHLFVGDRLRVVASGVVRSEAARRASDHLPAWVDLRFDPGVDPRVDPGVGAERHEPRGQGRWESARCSFSGSSWSRPSFRAGGMGRILVRSASDPIRFMALMALLPAIGAPIGPFLVGSGAMFGTGPGLALALLAMPIHLAAAILAARAVREPLMNFLERRGIRIPSVDAERQGLYSIVFFAARDFPTSSRTCCRPWPDSGFGTAFSPTGWCRGSIVCPWCFSAPRPRKGASAWRRAWRPSF